MKIETEFFKTYILPGLRAEHATPKTLSTALTEFAAENEVVDPDGSVVEIEAIHAKSVTPEPEPEAEPTEPAQLDIEVVRELVKKEVAKLLPKARTTGRLHVEIDEPEALKARQRGFKSYAHFCRDVYEAGKQGGVMTPELRAWHAKATTMQTGIGSEGGFLIPEAFSAQLLEKTYAESDILNRVTKIPIAGGNTVNIPCVVETSRADGSRQGGIRAYWKGENVQYTESDVDLGQVKLVAKKLTGLLKVTDEMLKFSAISIEPILSRMFAREMQFAIVNAVIRGDGSGKPLGILNAPCLVTVDKETGQAAATVMTENIKKMWSRLYGPLRGDAVWIINQDVWPELLELKLEVGSAGGSPGFIAPGMLPNAPAGSLLGRPIIECESSSTLGTAGDIMLCAFSDYLYASVPDAESMATSIHLNFDYGRTAYRFTMYADGSPWWKAALTPFSGSTNTLSPFVALALRA